MRDFRPREVGLHLRLYNDFETLISKALKMNIKTFQCFATSLLDGKYINLSERSLQNFLVLRSQIFDSLFLHASYGINIASLKSNGWHSFLKEVCLAETLGFTHLVLHPGTSKKNEDREVLINMHVDFFNRVFDYDFKLKMVLENVSHGVGGDLLDFIKILEKLKKPEKLSFCIDTAHAYSFGYNLYEDEGQAPG